MMQRTQVYFDYETLEALREEARSKKTTLAAVIRGKVAKSIGKKKKMIKKKSAREALLALAKLGERLKVHGPKDLSQRIDEFVYR